MAHFPDDDLDAELVDALAAVILDAKATPTAGREGVDVTATPLDRDAHLQLIQRCTTADEAVREFTNQAVDAARRSGVSWADIGRALGMSRQAAHQRFGGMPASPESATERWLGPVTAFNEMRELEIAGRTGWHTIGVGWMRHRMVHTQTQWEHRRLLWPQSITSLRRDGWQIGCRAFPWIYLVRDAGTPAQKE